MATDSVKDGGCPGTENDDDDHYFCLPKTAGASTDLSKIFQKAITAMVAHSRLIKIPEGA
jgi:phage FluMu gp28-like protein